MRAQTSMIPEEQLEKSKLTEHDIRLLLLMCMDLINLCARVTVRIAPEAAVMLAYVRDDIIHESKMFVKSRR